MALNPNEVEEYRKTTLDNLIADAVERKDEDGLIWLQEESKKKIKRVKADGTTTLVYKPMPAIRSEYAKKFLGYKVKGKQSAEEQRKRKQAKKEKEMADKFAKAFAQLKK